MENLYLTTQGIKGGNTTSSYKGYILLTHETNRISIDNFKGYGTGYIQRDEPEIIFQSGGKIIFEGTFDELKAALQKQNQIK